MGTAAPPNPPDPGGEDEGRWSAKRGGRQCANRGQRVGSGVLPPGIGGVGGGRLAPHRPLAGRRVLVTRARAQASELSRALAELGAVPVELPVIRFSDPDDYG